jgi:hypothetical protein
MISVTISGTQPLDLTVPAQLSAIMTDASGNAIEFSNMLINAVPGCTVGATPSSPFADTVTLPTDENGQVQFYLRCPLGGSGGIIAKQNGSGTGLAVVPVQFQAR